MQLLRSAAGAGAAPAAREEAERARQEDVDRAYDEEEALRSRERYRTSGIPSLAPDVRIGPHLGPDELVLGTRSDASVRRVDEDMRLVVRDEGPIYVTDRRLIHLGERVDSIPLLEIDELTMTDDLILVTLAGARGITLEVAEPNQLRVLIAAAKAALRAQHDASSAA